MTRHWSTRGWVRYGLAIGAPVLALLLRWAIVSWVGSLPTYITFYPAVMLAAVLAGVWPGVLATGLAALASAYFVLEPRGSFGIQGPADAVGLILFLCMGGFMCVVAGLYRQVRDRAAEYERRLALREAEDALRWQKDLLTVTLTSIGDAVLVTDTQGHVTFLNAQAERLTGWTTSEAAGRPIAAVINVVDEHGRRLAENPVEKILRLGAVVGPTDRNVLVARDGRETPADISGAPIRGEDGAVHGVVLVFRDSSQQREAERALRESEQRVRKKLDSILSPRGDIGNLQLVDIIDVTAVQSLMTDFYRLTGIPMAIIDLAGQVLVGVGWQDVCTHFHRVHPETHRCCLESDTQLTSGVAPGEFRLYKCKNHMWDIATPIMVGSQHVGNLFSGQFFFDDEQPDRKLFAEQADRYGFDREKYLAALDAVPRLSRETVCSGMSFLTRLANTISLLSYSNIKLARSLTERDRLAASLRQQENQQRAILENLDEGVVAVDMNAKVFHWNRAALAIHGYTSAEGCQRHLPEFADTFELATLDGTVLPVSEWPLSRVLRGERLCELELRLRHIRAGWERICSYSGSLVNDTDGQPSMAVVTIADITHRKVAEQALRESRQDLQRAQAVAQTGSWRLDVRRNQLRWSDETYRLFGIPQDTPLTYEAFLATVHPEDRDEVDRKWKAALRGEPYDVEHRIIVGNETKWVREKAELEFDAQGVLLGGFGTTQDITGKKLAEQALAAAMTSAKQAKAAAEEANQAKDQFLAVLSHELRTPLTPVLATVSLLQAEDPVESDVHRSLEVIRRNVELEARLIDDLLDVTRIARGKIELHKQPVVLGDVIRHAVDVCQADIEARQLSLRLDLGPAAASTIEADPARLQQVFWNLLKNAVKFSPQGGRVSIRSDFDGGRYVVTEVTDTGEGIEPAALTRIFNAFEQAGRSTSRQFGGLGLGLTISRTLVEMHGGMISAHSDGHGHGATFRVRLPVRATAVPAPAAAPAQPATGPMVGKRQDPVVRPLRVLLVEDHGDTARIMSQLLTRRGYEVHSAADVATALEVAGRHSFDLLISDVGLPDRSGLELIGELRARGLTMPAIALSGYGQEEDIQRSRRAGFCTHLTKPVNFEQFYQAITAVVQ